MKGWQVCLIAISAVISVGFITACYNVFEDTWWSVSPVVAKNGGGSGGTGLFVGFVGSVVQWSILIAVGKHLED